MIYRIYIGKSTSSKLFHFLFLETVSVFVIIIFFGIGLSLSLFPKTEQSLKKMRTPCLIEIQICTNIGSCHFPRVYKSKITKIQLLKTLKKSSQKALI